jgi:hypothetical protein
VIRVFTGFDPREAQGWHAFMASLIQHNGPEVAVSVLNGQQGDGTNSFTYERFRVPEYCGWGLSPALYVDAADMLLRAPLLDLVKLYDPTKAVQVVKHDYRTRHERKYVGTAMEAANADYPRKNWSSVILWNPAHPKHFKARIEMRGTDGKFLHRFGWLKDEEIGELPIEWNWLADEYGPNEKAKLLHWTAGIPGFAHYAQAPMAEEWHAAARTIHSER